MSVPKFSTVLLSLLVLTCQVFAFAAFAEVPDGEADLALIRAEETVGFAYQAALSAENAGSNISSLFVRLNDAGELLATARMSYRKGDFDTANILANLAENIGEDIQDDAVRLKDSALTEGSRRNLLTMTASVATAAAISVGSFGVWHRLRKRYGQYRGWFIVGSLALMLVVAVPASAIYIHMPSGSEGFSELWLLGPEHEAKDYPFNVRVDGKYGIYLGVGNHLGYSAYYLIEAKLQNRTNLSQNLSSSIPSPLTSTYEFQFFLEDGKIWETAVSFALEGTLGFVSDISINKSSYPLNLPSTWDQVRNGYYYQLFFELWLYNTTSQSFQFHNRLVGIWLNVTD